MSTTSKLGADMLNVPRELLQDLIDDVADYAVSRTFKDRETTWRSDLLKRADELLARQPSAIDKQDAVGQWVHCSPSLLNAGVSCANTPRRACECHPENCGHDHFIAHAAAPSVEQDEPVVMIQGRFVLEADPDFPDLPTHSAWSEIPTKESADRLKAKYGDKIELRELVARAASTSANVAQGADWSDRELNIHPDFKPFYAPFMKLWEAQVPTGDMKSLCFFFYRHGAQTANAAQGAEAQSGEAVCRVCNGHGYRTAMSATGEGAFNETCVYCKGTGKAAPPAQTALTDDARDAKRYRWLRENRPVLLLTGFFGNGCVNRRIEEADHEIDAALTAAQSASGDSYADKA